MRRYRAPGYGRYESDRRSRSPRGRSQDRFDGDRRRSLAEGRGAHSFQSNRDNFGDSMRREPPKGPRAQFDPPSGPRGGFSDGFRGGRGRGRGRGGPWRDDDRDRGRDRDSDFRERFREDRSLERDRDNRDRDWGDRRDTYRSRRSPPLRGGRSPARDFRERDRDGPAGIDAERPRRNSRDGPSIDSPLSEPRFGPPRGRGSFRGRNRGGRGGWDNDRDRGRPPFDDRNDRYPRSRSQEGRWAPPNRDRDDRDRNDRYPETELRRDPRADRGDLFENKMGARSVTSQEPPSHKRDVSPPPVAPSAPAFGTVPNRGDGQTGRLPPTAPRAFSERHGQDTTGPPSGPSRDRNPDSPPIPVGPRAHQQKTQRPSSKQWINPNLKRVPDSPKMMRAPSINQPRPGPPRRESSQMDQSYEERRPESSGSRGGYEAMDIDKRRGSTYSVEPGEIMSKSDEDMPVKPEPDDRRRVPAEVFRSRDDDEEPTIKSPAASLDSQRPRKTRPRRRLQFSEPLKIQPQPLAEPDSESDDDEDMMEYFNMEIGKTESEMSKLQLPDRPTEVVARFAYMSHGAMVKILSEKDGLEGMIGEMPVDLAASSAQGQASTLVSNPIFEAKKESAEGETQQAAETEAESRLANLELRSEAMEVDQIKGGEKFLHMVAGTGPPDVPATGSKPTPAFTSVEQRTGELPSAEHIIPTTQAEEAPLPTTETGSKPPSTPSQIEDEGDDEETESEDDEYLEIVDPEVIRKHMETPPLDDLPHFDVLPWDQETEFKSMDSDTFLDGYIIDHLTKVSLDRVAEQRTSQIGYVKNYRDYVDFTQSDDPIATKSRDKLIVPGPPVEVPGPTTPEPTSTREGRGSRRYASERDLERVLQASMREEDERRERELRMQKEKYRGDKEATIPEMFWDVEEKQQEQFHDLTGFVPPERLVSTWEVMPPLNNFNREENEAFERIYLQLPKQWGKVAEVMPNRDFGACIQYYYLMKKDLNLKDKLKRQPKKRKKGGRGKQRSSALVSELGNGDAEGDDNNDNGENGDNRRRLRRAAAPTFGFEQPPTESESGTPIGTPGRRGPGASKGDQPEKVDGRKNRKRKDKDPKLLKPNQMLAAAPGPGRARSRSDVVKGQSLEFQTPMSGDIHRLPTHFEQQAAGMQAAFPVGQLHQQAMSGLDRGQPLGPGPTMADVMAAPSLRPEPPPPPQPAMTTFNLSQPQAERKAPTQASSYWSVSESNDFPGLLKAFGSNWTAIAAHMGSKTAVMVKNYYVRQKEAGRVEWEAMVQEADAKDMRGEKRPDPPQPTTTGRGRRYDTSVGGPSRPLAAAPGGIELAPEPPRPKTEAGPPPGPQGYPAYGVPLAQAPTQSVMGDRGQKPIAIQQQPSSQQQHPPVSQAMSPTAPSLRAPPQPFAFERERERERERDQAQQRIPLPQQAAGQPHPDASRPPLHHSQAESIMERQKREIIQQQQQQQQPEPSMERQKREIIQQQQQQRERERERERELELRERERERDRDRQAERRAMGLQPEQDRPRRQYDAFGRPLFGPRDASRGDPLALSRHPQDAVRLGGPQYQPPHTSSQPMRSLLSDLPPAQSPPSLGPPTSRPLSPMQHRQTSGSAAEFAPNPQSSSSAPPAPAARPPEPRKSNIMSLLNDDPPPPPKRVNDVSARPPSTSATPPPQGIGRPPAGPQPPSHLRRESEQQYSPYARPPSTAPSGMPSLKPSYSSPSQPSRSAYAPIDSPGERDMYGRPYQTGHQSQTNSPQATHQYPAHPGRGQGQSQSGYPSAYGAGQPPPASSPPPQFSLNAPPRPGETPRGGRDSWIPGHQQGPPSGSWGREPPKASQPPPPQHPWGGSHGGNTPKAGTPVGQWPAAPPPQQPHPGMRDDRGPSMYGSQQQPQHQMQGRYAQPPPSSRGPESVPPPAQAYPRYATPGPGTPRDPRDMPPRSYTPAGYDGRGPPHPAQPGPGYPGADPRDMQLREARDPRDQQMSDREMVARGLRPPEYGRPGDPYSR